MKQKISNKRWLWEFSKRLVLACSILYFAGVVFSCVVMTVSKEYDALPVLIENLHQMLIVCVFGYFVKACVENTYKIKLNKNEEEDE